MVNSSFEGEQDLRETSFIPLSKLSFVCLFCDIKEIIYVNTVWFLFLPKVFCPHTEGKVRVNIVVVC